MACHIKNLLGFLKNVSWISPGNLLKIGKAAFVDTLLLQRVGAATGKFHACCFLPRIWRKLLIGCEEK